MPATPSDIKKALAQAGFEVYRTRGDVVHVAERVRENLLMDSGVRISTASAAVSFVVRAQRRDFPEESDVDLFSRARRLADDAVRRGYAEVAATVTPVFDPSDNARTLDTWYEVAFQKSVEGLEVIIEEVRFAMELEKSAGPREA